jgi:hypothetical protein
MLEYWDKINAFETSLKFSEGKPEFTFYDGCVLVLRAVILCLLRTRDTPPPSCAAVPLFSSISSMVLIICVHRSLATARRLRQGSPTTGTSSQEPSRTLCVGMPTKQGITWSASLGGIPTVFRSSMRSTKRTGSLGQPMSKRWALPSTYFDLVPQSDSHATITFLFIFLSYISCRTHHSNPTNTVTPPPTAHPPFLRGMMTQTISLAVLRK